MSGDLTIIIPTILERAQLFAEAVTSVQGQTLQWPYLSRVDEDYAGPATNVNALAAQVDTEWLFRLDDDDLLDPDHNQTLSYWLDDDADIVFTWCRLDGAEPEDYFQARWQDEHGWEYLYHANWIPCSAAVRVELWRELGGLRDIPEEDWDFWKRALDAGARFRCVPAVTWSYRVSQDWEHRSAYDRARVD